KRAVLGKDHPDFARSLNDLARFYEIIGNYKQAEPLFQQALAIRRKALGNDHPDCAQSLNDLALLYESMSRLEEGEKLALESQQIRRRELGENHPDYAEKIGRPSCRERGRGQVGG